MFNNLMEAIEARPKNFGPMKAASAHARITGPCGDTVEIWLQISGGRIRKGSFMSDGCAYSVYCCSTAVKLAEGMLTEQAAQLTQAQVLEATGPVPDDHRHCALLAANTIQKAIANFYETPAKQPFWQKLRGLFNK